MLDKNMITYLTEELDRQRQSGSFNFSCFVRFGPSRDQARWVRELASPKKITRPSRKFLGDGWTAGPSVAFRSLVKVPCHEKHDTGAQEDSDQ